MNAMKKYLILIILIVLPLNAIASPQKNESSTGSKLAWITTLFFIGPVLQTIPCVEVPAFSSFHTGSKDLDLSQSGEWKQTGIEVSQNKLITFDWSTKGITSIPRKYLVLYRIDPRFKVPQLFIQTWVKDKYTTDFKKSQTIDKYKTYFDNSHKAIKVEAGDVINITLIDSSVFLNSNTTFTGEIDSSKLDPSLIYTPSSIDNNIIYTTAEQFCGASALSSLCKNSGQDTKYKNDDKFAFVGKPGVLGFDFTSLKPCPLGSNDKNLFCAYDKGRGMRIILGDGSGGLNGDIIKMENESFVHSSYTAISTNPPTNADFLYYRSKKSGFLDFTTGWDILSMFPQPSGSWREWIENIIDNYINIKDFSTSFMHFGRYAMKIEIGSGDNTISFDDQDSIKVEYIIVDKNAPQKLSPSISGTSVDQNYKGDANISGFLWVRVLNPSTRVNGIIRLNYGYYNGSTFVSDLVYTKIVSPLRVRFNDISEKMFIKFTTDSVLKRISQTMLTLYILIYGLLFLIGSVKVTAQDIIIRVVKISIVVVLFSEDSWNFFNNNLFNLFVNGSNYLMSNIIGVSSSATNVFGFIDPIFDKYTDPKIWSLLFFQLIQIHNGLAFFAAMVIYSILLYFRAVLEVIIGYILGFMCLAVMISLAPFFITLILFQQTRSLFDNWLSTLFSYMIQPTILLIFFLLIDQVMSEQLIKAVVRSCWDVLINIKINLDLSHIGIPLNFSFSLPFLPGIPFFIPVVAAIQNMNDLNNNVGSIMVVATSSLLFYAYCLMCHGLVEYVTIIVGSLTNVAPAKMSEENSASSNPTNSIMGDMEAAAKPVTSRIKGAANTIWDKTINQNYRSNAGGGSEDGDKRPNYSSKLQSKDGGDEANNSKPGLTPPAKLGPKGDGSQ